MGEVAARGPRRLAVEVNGHNAPRFSRTRTRTVLLFGDDPECTRSMSDLLRALGVFMGHSWTAQGQDWAFSLPVLASPLGWHMGPERTTVEHLRDTIRHRNANHACWGLVLGSDLAELSLFEDDLRDTYFVVAAKPLADVVLAANELHGSLQSKLLVRARTHARVCGLLASRGYPGLVIDVQRGLTHARELAAELVRGVGLAATEQDLKLAASGLEHPDVSAGPSGPCGYVDDVSERLVRGWAADAKDPTLPVSVALIIDGRPAGEARAVLDRPDVRAAGQHPTGTCGYELPIVCGSPLRAGQEVRVVDTRTGRDLQKSGILFRPGFFSCFSPSPRVSSAPYARGTEMSFESLAGIFGAGPTAERLWRRAAAALSSVRWRGRDE